MAPTPHPVSLIPVLDSVLPPIVPSPAGLSLSISKEPIPAHLTNRIQLVEMRDLLGDNMALTQQFESAAVQFPLHTVLPASSRPRMRDVSSWIYCFLTYLAVVTTDLPTRNRLIYAQLVVREALRHGGRGWLDYDRLFRQQAALNPSIPWDTLNPGLLASTVLGQRPTGGTFCNIARVSTTSQLSVRCLTSRCEPCLVWRVVACHQDPGRTQQCAGLGTRAVARFPREPASGDMYAFFAGAPTTRPESAVNTPLDLGSGGGGCHRRRPPTR